ncbi:MAG TPA: isochorismatase family protein [Acidocella sp.]|nr:isochorismatase family protein [Acidocella sp.]HQU04266.1 isochorismatase family protein [Acidocella sp.]
MALLSGSAYAQTIIDQWDSVKAPPAPVLQAVKADPATTAFLVLDISVVKATNKGPCNSDVTLCTQSVPFVKAMLEKARAAGVYVVYSVSSATDAKDILPPVAPQPNDPVVKSGPDKFVNTNLAELLAAKNIKTVIIVGVSADGAVLNTATDAILQHGMNVIIPVDGVSAKSLYVEQYVAWFFTHAPVIATRAVITKGDMISY